MGSSGILKSALFFLCVMLAALLLMPKDCAKNAARPLAALRHAKSGGGTSKGLRIDSSTPPPDARNVAFPAGLDAGRLQYLVEVDPQFSAPKTLTCPKRPGGPPLGSPELQSALQSLRYIEMQPDGAFALTREGLLNANATDNGPSWSVPVAKRQFAGVDKIDCSAADQCTVTFKWAWQPNDVGQAMQPQLDPHNGTAHIVSGPDGWALRDVADIDAGL
jgi:hypothetical protein